MIPERVKEKWVIKEKDEGVRFRTFHVVGKDNASVMAASIPLYDDPTVFEVQFSFLSPKEEREGFVVRQQKILHSLDLIIKILLLPLILKTAKL